MSQKGTLTVDGFEEELPARQMGGTLGDVDTDDLYCGY
jgi:hypothetical protein